MMRRTDISYLRKDCNIKRISVCFFIKEEYPECLKYLEWIKKVSENYKHINVYVFDQENYENLCKAHDIRYFPTTMIYANDCLVNTIIGFKKEVLDSAIDEEYTYIEKNTKFSSFKNLLEKIKNIQP